MGNVAASPCGSAVSVVVVNLPFANVSRFVSRSLTGNSAAVQETAVPPKSERETRTSHAPPMSDEFVSAQKALLPRWR
jgi:hypothetical protein